MSSVLGYFKDAVVNTYNQTVDYWSKDGSIADAGETIVWSLNNTDTVATATKKGVDKSLDELGTAVTNDLLKIGLFVGAAVYIYKKYIKGGK